MKGEERIKSLLFQQTFRLLQQSKAVSKGLSQMHSKQVSALTTKLRVSKRGDVHHNAGLLNAIAQPEPLRRHRPKPKRLHPMCGAVAGGQDDVPHGEVTKNRKGEDEMFWNQKKRNLS